MLPAESWDMIRARQRRATLTRAGMKMIDKREKEYQAFGEFLRRFIHDLNQLSDAGWAVLVEGPRDIRAVKKLGFEGRCATVGEIGRRGVQSLGVKKVVILTDLDREGALLASRFVKQLTHEGLKTSLNERRRLKAASRGVFLHVENLSRFAPEDV